MIRRISRTEAMARARASLAEASTDCPLCFVLSLGETPIASEGDCVLLPNRFPLRWGHLMVIPKLHVESFGALSDEVHAAAARLTLLASRALERTLRPGRVYTASLGSLKPELKITTPHVHWHVVPVGDERAADVFTWSSGVLAGDEEDWAALATRIRRAIEVLRRGPDASDPE
ncbi:MAG: HIT family protein [Polyangiaceae bacterium]